jgi:SAM-dependent methyltransferase
MSRPGAWEADAVEARRYWDQYFRTLRETGGDLDWEGRWTEPFLGALHELDGRRVLELGCGTGNDAARLARAGCHVTALDLSTEAIAEARRRFGELATFLVADMAEPLGYPDGAFDAVMSNVALHRFADAVTRAIFAEIGRVVRPGGLFLFHVNAREDRPLRERRFLVVRQVEDDFVVEQGGQPMRFFSADYLRDLLREWDDVSLDLVEICDNETGAPFKYVWRGVARRS